MHSSCKSVQSSIALYFKMHYFLAFLLCYMILSIIFTFACWIFVPSDSPYNTLAMWNTHHFWMYFWMGYVHISPLFTLGTVVVWEIGEYCMYVGFASEYWGEEMARKLQNVIADIAGFLLGYILRGLIDVHSSKMNLQLSNVILPNLA